MLRLELIIDIYPNKLAEFTQTLAPFVARDGNIRREALLVAGLVGDQSPRLIWSVKCNHLQDLKDYLDSVEYRTVLGAASVLGRIERVGAFETSHILHLNQSVLMAQGLQDEVNGRDTTSTIH